MRRPLVAGNWKLNGSRLSSANLVHAICAGLRPDRRSDVMVCPPFVYLAEVGARLGVSGVLLGAQNASAEATGAYTGEISAAMLRDVGCTHVIVGHSERRALYAESDEVVARKFIAATAAGLQPILCVGETLEERQQGHTENVVRRQLEAVLDRVPAGDFAAAVVAYEPVWAIGTGQTATPAQAQDVHAFIRGLVAARSARMAGELRLLYGGSVKGSNAAALFAMPDIDGGLVGGASLDAADFLSICSAASGIS
jgi:triosephosphate isomerase (TIM)